MQLKFIWLDLKKKIQPLIIKLVVTLKSFTFLRWYEFFFCFRKHYHPVIWTTQVYYHKYYFKTLLSHKNYGSSVKVNVISDGLCWHFVWQNATNVYYTNKKLPSTSRILHSGGLYSHSNVISGTETYVINLIFMW